MSLIHQASEMERAISKLKEDAIRMQQRSNLLISALVSAHQEYRLARNFEMSDRLRALLADVGVKIIQGTAGYDFDKIPAALQGRQVNDTWMET